MKKFLALLSCAVLMAATAVGCGSQNEKITVVSREDGSGTRSAFSELMGVVKDDKDNTTDTAEVTNSTSVMLTTVAGNKAAIGYVSLGSLNDTVKAVKVDGVEATAENVKAGKYAVSRPFNIVTGKDLTPLAQDFISYILSTDGQAVVDEKGYISITQGETYKASGQTGTLTIAGSTSVAPLMEVLADKYMALNSGVKIEIQQSGSSAGITSAVEGVCQIGMASRELKDSETAKGVTATKIAMDGIAVIVNKDNSCSELTSDQIRKIYTGETTQWSDLK
ncbi:substrate-binding domain-containing protein [Ruminococcus champanellensis]|uniref:Phosphate ABC transporter substrate-binding protein, PhoT family (TC 3.A.1.7.1) n=1 Tax=Ruminococcus champanellensis (strain DSM 18848 / JCM 17042 / KCTC 15320 / 18P13) TaxID=213810 RepID=D4LB04_RUMC1|nr:phosphate ABC transporter substrate-binding protein, PhoT family (TC 3.A.1.7.1) [Ruminococcus champanellensis 18P13 = JCM 17042]